MGERAHLSIGEVLSLVQEEFPDITISKIRFLESQGLLDPERTPSGYRKFYRADIDRLQWILTQQRDHFLPLKVIRERLAEWDATGTPPAGRAQSPPSEDLPGAGHAADQPGPAGEPDPGPAPGSDPVSATPAPAPAEDAVSEARRAASSLAAGSAEEVSDGGGHPADEAGSVDGPDPGEEPGPALGGPAGGQAAADPGTAGVPGFHVGPQDTALTADELAERAGVEVRVIRELESYSMIESRRVGPETYYDPEHLAVVRACRAFLDHGVEVRHLRMYKIAAEREAGMFEQLVMPLLKQRNPEARATAAATVQDLAEVGEELHAALLRQALQHTLP